MIDGKIFVLFLDLIYIYIYVSLKMESNEKKRF